MSLEDPNAPNYVRECIIHTEANTKMTELRFVVENVSKLPNDKKVIERTFYPSPDWICYVSFGIEENLFYLDISNKSDIEAKIVVKRTLYNCNNGILYDRDEEIHSLKKDQEIDMLYDVNYELVDFDQLPNDILIIDLTFLSLPKIKAGLFLCDTDPERKLREDYKTMLENPVNPDVTLVIGEERIPAHWAILCSRSQYFKNIYESNMQESIQNHVTITDISVTTLKHLIRFLHSACFFENSNVDREQLFDLYYAADRYEIMDLRALCARRIMSIASVDNVCRILQLARRHFDKELNMQAMVFFEEHSETVLKSESWKQFEANDPLTADIFKFFLQEN